ncbi:hypothetical protein J2S40_003975 [Nocardioides luteus]|uniref:ABM domain-containing protein n=1 Tax=Nocardioides luteus TaxID=1844 RepID=A0ABQ5SR01_9ACTN|nr:hypothetical protein [Nocardioides luteus]MDR7312917.1 hypothetical protein [Nocardioides luteus]GGR45382.1 hypothetical protein GCM10010197_08820 [Nocardioides luteus]GLJ65978.1 hypothetical protein GCM10017579_00140 [Nocardioides luteus]
MFIQMIQGPCSRQDEAHQLLDEWRRDLAPGATGWLGGTYGFTDDGQLIGVVRFESREAAMANSERPEQGEWAKRMTEVLDGPMEFHDCDDVTLILDGGSDDAGFVQIIRGRVEDPSRLKAMVADTSMLHEARPESIGGTLAIEDDGSFIDTIAFTTEDEARKGEQIEPPPEMRRELEYAMKGATYYDLHHPWFESA